MQFAFKSIALRIQPYINCASTTVVDSSCSGSFAPFKQNYVLRCPKSSARVALYICNQLQALLINALQHVLVVWKSCARASKDYQCTSITPTGRTPVRYYKVIYFSFLATQNLLYLLAYIHINIYFSGLTMGAHKGTRVMP